MSLDLASRTGAARWAAGWRAPTFETWRLTVNDDQVGLAQEQLRQKLVAWHNEAPITYLCFESPILPRGRWNPEKQQIESFTRIETVRLAFGLAAHVEWFAHCVEAECREASQSAWRKYFLGKGTGKSAELKKLAIERCKALGWNVATDHEADACGILSFALDTRGVHLPWRDALIFGAAA